MSPLEVAFWFFMAVLWASAIFLLAQDVHRWFKQHRAARRLSRYMRSQAQDYRDLDLEHPIGRTRLGIRNKEEE